MSPFLGPTGSVQPGLRAPLDRQGAGAFSPWTQFSPSDLNACYPTPPWVAQRLRDYPQTSVGNALRDPLPVPFTAEEVTRALSEVWQASHQPVNRACATVAPAAVQIALQVLPVLQSRNGGWIDFSSSYYNPMVNTPGSNVGRGVNLQCVLYRLVGKTLPPAYNACNWTPAPPQRTYSLRDVQTTFDPSVQPASVPSSPGGPVGGHPPIYGRPAAPSTGFLGHELEAAPEPEPDPFSYNLFTIVETFDIKEP